MRSKPTSVVFPWCGAFGGVVSQHDRPPTAATLVEQAVGLSPGTNLQKEPFAQTNLRTKCHCTDWMAPAPQQLTLGSPWNQTKQGGGQSTSLELEQKRGKQGHGRGESRDFLLRVGNSWISSVAPETVSWRKQGLWQNPGGVAGLGYAPGCLLWGKRRFFFLRRVGDRKNNIKQLEFQWVLDF